MKANSLRSFSLSLMLAVSVAGCAAHDGATPSTAPAQSKSSAPTQTARTPEPAKPTPEPEINAPKPAEIMGSGSSELVAALGSATLVRTDIGAEIWQYRTEDCVLFLFLYPKDAEMAVRHIDSRGGPSAETCIRSVVKTRLSRQTG